MTGAIGSALVQLLHAAGVEVVAVCDRLPADRSGLVLGHRDVEPAVLPSPANSRLDRRQAR